jgi:hypothetical protein
MRRLVAQPNPGQLMDFVGIALKPTCRVTALTMATRKVNERIGQLGHCMMCMYHWIHNNVVNTFGDLSMEVFGSALLYAALSMFQVTGLVTGTIQGSWRRQTLGTSVLVVAISPRVRPSKALFELFHATCVKN